MVLGGRMMGIYLPKGKTKRFVTFLVFMLLMISSLWGALYISVQTSSSLNVTRHLESIQLMAVDHNPDGDLVLQKEGGVFRLQLDKWVAGSAKTYPAAFALVNPANETFSIRSIRLKGDPKYINVYLHRNMTRPVNETLVEIPNTYCDDDAQLYYSNGTSLEYDDGWVLGPGEGYNGDDLVYKNATTSASATLSDELWIHNSSGPVEAENGTANFVWVEINIYPPTNVVSQHFSGPLIIEMDIDITPPAGQVIDFMAAGRRDGGYVLTRDINSTIRISLDGLKPGMNLTIPDAFAIVNTAPSQMRLTKIEVTGDTNGYLRIYAHSNYTKPSNASISNIPDEYCDPTAQLYYNGTSIDWSEGGWIIGSGVGYNTTGNLMYTDNGQMDHAINATRKGGYPNARYYFWAYDEDPASGSNFAGNSTANFVWIEISVVVPDGAEDTTVDSTIKFHFSST